MQYLVNWQKITTQEICLTTIKLNKRKNKIKILIFYELNVLF
jgi:hypothetical protein